MLTTASSRVPPPSHANLLHQSGWPVRGKTVLIAWLTHPNSKHWFTTSFGGKCRKAVLGVCHTPSIAFRFPAPASFGGDELYMYVCIHMYTYMPFVVQWLLRSLWVTGC